MSVKIDISKVSVGDVIMIKNKSNVSTASYRQHLKEFVPYFVSGTWITSFSIDCMGKNATIFTSDLPYIEFIYSKKELMECKIEEGVVLNVGDNIIITNINKIKGADNLGFKEGVKYEITKVAPSYIYIVNDKSELLIEEDEFGYIKHESTYEDKELESIFKDFYDMYKQNEIDRLLDVGDFEGLEKLMK